MTNNPPPVRRDFHEAANPPPKRPPPSKREIGDLRGADMVRYVQGLEARLEKHLMRHAPQWQVRETREILARWHKPKNDHPAPSWAGPRDRVNEAANYARLLIAGRCDARFKALAVIRTRLDLSQAHRRPAGPDYSPRQGGPST